LDIGDTAADIGSGTGYFTIPMAKTVDPANKVYALDISEEMLLEVGKRAGEADVKNIVAIHTNEYDLKLNDDTVSYSLMVNVLHEIEDKERFIKEVKRITKKEGKIAIIEWVKKQTDMGPPVEERLDKNTVKTLLEIIGFQIIIEAEFADRFYAAVAKTGS
jgi:ubiquinone/menaquinone biosynthesis C-methylase UbiE